MILREIFEARAKAKSVGIIFGRFNPPHMGHMKAWEMASENSVWYVGTNKSTQGPKDPLPFDIKVKAMEAVYPEVKGHIVAETSWLTLASKVYEKHGNIVLNVYTDEDWVTKTLIQYNGKEGTHGYYEFGTIQQQTTPRLSSATSLRNAVAADDRDLFGQAAGVDPNTLVAGHAFFDVVKHYLMPHAEKAAAKAAKKQVKEPVAENNSIGTMPTTEYVKGIYAAAAENGMGAPAVDAVKKQMVLAPNGEVDIIATMQKALQVFQSPAWKKMIADLTALVKKAEAQQSMSSGINELSNELLGRYKKSAGADAKKADADGEYARGNKRFSGIVKATKKQFANDEKGVAENKLGNVIPWPEVVNKVNSAMKATGWKGKRMGEESFMYTTKGQETDDQWYVVMIANAGEGFFTYALGTVEDGDPHIDDAFKGNLPNTEASVSELLNEIRDGFGLNENVTEGTSIESTLRAVINDIGEPITNVYDTMKFQAKKYMENHGELDRGFRMVAAGIGGRWVQSMYVGRLQNELYDLCKYNTRRTVELKQFLRGIETDGELEMKRSFGSIANELPRILAKLGQHLDASQLTKNANRWMQNKAAYEEYIANLELEDDYDKPSVPTSPKNPAIGQQRSQVEDIVNDVLSKLPKKIAGDIRNAIARSPNKLQALQAELQKRGQKSVAENAWDRLQRERALESAGVGIITKQNTTVDVNKNTPKKNLKAFRLA